MDLLLPVFGELIQVLYTETSYYQHWYESSDCNACSYECHFDLMLQMKVF